MTYNNHQSNPIHPSDRIPTYRKTEKKTRIKKIKIERKKKKKKREKNKRPLGKTKKSMKLALNDSLRVELKILTYLYERQRLPITIKGCLKIDPCQDYFIFKGGEGGGPPV